MRLPLPQPQQTRSRMNSCYSDGVQRLKGRAFCLSCHRVRLWPQHPAPPVYASQEDILVSYIDEQVSCTADVHFVSVTDFCKAIAFAGVLFLCNIALYLSEGCPELSNSAPDRPISSCLYSHGPVQHAADGLKSSHKWPCSHTKHAEHTLGPKGECSIAMLKCLCRCARQGTWCSTSGAPGQVSHTKTPHEPGLNSPPQPPAASVSVQSASAA